MILNYNSAITSNFKVTIPGEQKLEFYAHSINIPTTTLSPIEVNYKDTRIKVPDNKYIWDDITIQFLLDEDLYSYELLRGWLIKVRSEEYWQKGLKDINILPLDSNKNIEYSWVAQGAWPNMIGGWQYSSGQSGSEFIMFDVTFSYQHLDIKRNKPLNFSII